MAPMTRKEIYIREMQWERKRKDSWKSDQDLIQSDIKINLFWHKPKYQLQQAQHAQLRTTAYKLPPDVELSKTTSPDEDIKSGKLEEKSDLPLSAPLSEPSSLKRSTSLHRRESSSDRLKPESLSPHVVNNVDDFKPQQNGRPFFTMPSFKI